MLNLLRELFRRNGGVTSTKMCCSFCRKNSQEVGPLVEGPNEVYICGECVALSQLILDQERLRRAEDKVDAAPAPEK